MSANRSGSPEDAIVLRSVGGSSAQGQRPSQQDRYTILLPDQFPSKTGDRGIFLAVYDGHASKKVAEHASQHLHKFFIDSPEFETGRYEEAIRAAIATEEHTLLNKLLNDEENRFAVSGSTAVVCYVNLTKGILVVGNLGDSHALLAECDAQSGQAVSIRRITQSHKPDNPDEKGRIEDAGGKINDETGTARLGALNMSRALGDLQYKNPLNKVDMGRAGEGDLEAASAPSEQRGDFLSSKPHLARIALEKDRRYILAVVTDGVLDAVEEDTLMRRMCELSSSQGLEAEEISWRVVNEVGDMPKSDNATCVTAFLDGCKSKLR